MAAGADLFDAAVAWCARGGWDLGAAAPLERGAAILAAERGLLRHRRFGPWLRRECGEGLDARLAFAGFIVRRAADRQPLENALRTTK